MNKDNNIKLIHIGKCGGSYIKHTLTIPEYHFWNTSVKEPIYKLNEKYIIWIRHPIKRFISAFNHSHSIITTRKTKKQIPSINKNTSPVPEREIKKIRTGTAFNKIYDFLISYFKSPNHLAESLTSDNITEKKNAILLMNNTTEHIYKGIGWYLQNGEFVKHKHKQILFVGSIENIKQDCKTVCKLLNINFISHNPIRVNNNNNTFLSNKAITNLMNFYKNTDYKAIQELYKYNFISEELFDSYQNYTNN
tara:strand:+ start:5937 stop:6686 length:750 start_codon:yes stop_codon:yes gene_type:complete